MQIATSTSQRWVTIKLQELYSGCSILQVIGTSYRPSYSLQQMLTPMEGEKELAALFVLWRHMAVQLLGNDEFVQGFAICVKR